MSTSLTLSVIFPVIVSPLYLYHVRFCQSLTYRVCLCCFFSLSPVYFSLFWRSMLTLDLLRCTKCTQRPRRLVMLSHSSASLQGRNPSSDSVEDGFLKEDPLQFTVRQHRRCHKDEGFLMWKIRHREMSADKQLQLKGFYLILTPFYFSFFFYPILLRDWKCTYWHRFFYQHLFTFHLFFTHWCLKFVRYHPCSFTGAI